MQKILILGGSTFDHIVHVPKFPDPIPQTIHQTVFYEGCGSTGIGKALALTKLGVPNYLYTAFGDDVYGREIELYLYKNSVENTVIIDPKGTERHINLMDDAGNRISMFITQSSETLPHDERIIQQLINDCDIIVLNIIPYCLQLIPLIKASGKPVWTDLHDYDGINPYHQPFIDAAQYIHLSSDNLPDYKPVMQQLLAPGKEMVICTHGKKGSSVLLADETYLEEPIKYQATVVDSNGAGDSYFAGFLYGFINNQSIQNCMRYGAACGAMTVEDKNLVALKLSEKKLEEFMREFYP